MTRSGTKSDAAFEGRKARSDRREVERILATAVAGERLSGDRLESLFDGTTLHQLGTAGHAVRCCLNPAGEATYVLDRNINYMNVCVYRCRFCAFYRKPGAAAAVLPFDAIADEVEETVAAGGTGILLQGDVHRNLRLEFYEGLLLQPKATLPAVRLHAFSAPGVWYIAEVYRMPLSDVTTRLRGAGLESIPAAAPKSSKTTRKSASGRGQRPRPRSGSKCTGRRMPGGCARP